MENKPHRIELNWKEGMAFEAEIGTHKLILDAAPEVGGSDQGPRPKELMLVSLAGCTGMDVVAILRKMKVQPDDFRVSVEAPLTEEHPRQYTGMHIRYSFWGKNLDREKLEKAVNLSQEKYCGVSAMYRKAMPLSFEIIVHEPVQN